MWKIIKIRDLIVFQICTFIRFGLKPFNKLVLLSFFSRWGSSAGGKLKSQWTQPPTKESWWLTTWPSSSNLNRMKSASRPSRASERATQPYGSSPTAVSAEPPPSHAQRPVPLLLSHTVWQRVPCLTCGDPRNDGIDGDAWICVWEWTSESRIHHNPSWSCQTPPPSHPVQAGIGTLRLLEPHYCTSTVLTFPLTFPMKAVASWTAGEAGCRCFLCYNEFKGSHDSLKSFTSQDKGDSAWHFCNQLLFRQKRLI